MPENHSRDADETIGVDVRECTADHNEEWVWEWTPQGKKVLALDLFLLAGTACKT